MTDQPTRAKYETPTGDDEPLDRLEQAFVRAMVSALLKQIRKEEAAAQGSTSEDVKEGSR